jgi:uncharacterized LabA/DUF88 family protein
MVRAAFLIDGFNMYHALACNSQFRRYKWLNYRELCGCYVKKTEQIVSVCYFTSYNTYEPQKTARHQIYVAALQSVGVVTIFGAYKIRDRKCKICKNVYQGLEEKLTDVNIAVKLLEQGINNTCDLVFLISGDNDLVPAIRSFKRNFPQKELRIVIPIGRRATKLLKQEAGTNQCFQMKEKHLASSQFPSVIHLPNGYTLHKPSIWP